MFHEGQKNLSYFCLTVDGNFCSEALTSVMKHLNLSNSQRSRAREVAITLFKQREHAQALISQEQKPINDSLQFVHLTKVCGDSPSTKKIRSLHNLPFLTCASCWGQAEGAQDCLRKPANLAGA